MVLNCSQESWVRSIKENNGIINKLCSRSNVNDKLVMMFWDQIGCAYDLSMSQCVASTTMCQKSAYCVSQNKSLLCLHMI